MSDALRRVQQMERARTKGKPLSRAMEESIDEEEPAAKK